MPIINIKLVEGRTLEQKRALVAEVTQAVCRTVNVQPEAVTITLDELKTENLAQAGILRADK